MSDKRQALGKGGKPSDRASARRERLAKELRANLMRRKEQARTLAGAKDEPEGDKT